MTKVRKCHICGKELHDITKKGFEYSPLFKNAAGNYLTFNLFNAKDHYRMVFDINEGEGVEIPCSMIQADTGTEVLRTEVMNLFSAPATMIN